MSGHYGHYDFEGKPIDPLTWASMLDSPARIVGHTAIGEVHVSTVWIGIDHGFGQTERPLIYETMIFRPDDYDETYRYATLADAQLGHSRLVAELELLAGALGVDVSDEPQA